MTELYTSDFTLEAIRQLETDARKRLAADRLEYEVVTLVDEITTLIDSRQQTNAVVMVALMFCVKAMVLDVLKCAKDSLEEVKPRGVVISLDTKGKVRLLDRKHRK